MFESRLGLEFSGFSVWLFSEARRQGFSSDTPVSSPPSKDSIKPEVWQGSQSISNFRVIDMTRPVVEKRSLALDADVLTITRALRS